MPAHDDGGQERDQALFVLSSAFWPEEGPNKVILTDLHHGFVKHCKEPLCLVRHQLASKLRTPSEQLHVRKGTTSAASFEDAAHRMENQYLSKSNLEW